MHPTHRSASDTAALAHPAATPSRLTAAQPPRRRVIALALGAALSGLLMLGGCAVDAADVEPATPDAPAAFQESAPSDAARTPASTLNFPVTEEPAKVAPWFKVHRPTDLKAPGRPLPVIAWANGGCFRSSFTWKPLFDRWAAAGFIVLALDANPAQGLFGALASSTPQDHGQLIDWITTQNETQGSPYYGLVDTKRVVAAGNSCGGVTALQLTAKDPRVAAVFVLSGSSALAAVDTAAMKAIKVPVGYIVGGKEDIAGPNAAGDYDALPEGVPAMLVSRATGDHVMVSTTPAILAEEARISLDWLDLALYGTPEALATLTSPSVCTGCQVGTWLLKAKNLETLVQ